MTDDDSEWTKEDAERYAKTDELYAKAREVIVFLQKKNLTITEFVNVLNSIIKSNH